MLNHFNVVADKTNKVMINNRSKKNKDDELESAIDIIESSMDGLDNSITLFETKEK